MKMLPIYDKVGLLLGHIEQSSIINRHHDVAVVEDVSVEAYSGPPHEVQTTANFYVIAKRQVHFFRDYDKMTQTYLVADAQLPKWFWKNEGAVEFKPEHFERMPL